MLLFVVLTTASQDGSRHAWLAEHPPLDRIVTMDDATSAIDSAFPVEEEGTFSSFRGLAAVIAAPIGGARGPADRGRRCITTGRPTAVVIERHGLFSSLDTDRDGHYFHTPRAGGKVAEDQPTEVGRALRQLGIAPIPAYSPEARGRMERVFGTLQRRLPQELRLAGITTIEAANRFLAGRFIPEHNRRFAVAAAEPGSAFVPFAGDLAEILCVQAERVVGHDNCVRYAGLSLQIPEQRHRHHFVKVTVRVHEHADGSLAVFHGPRCLARYGADGRLSVEEQAESAA